MKYYQVSPGSVGSCSIEDLLPTKINIPRHVWNAHERDFTKLDREGGDVRACYIYGNPYNIVLSYFRRNFMRIPYDHCRHMTGNLSALYSKNIWTLDDYLKNGKDLFNMREHFYGWYNHDNRKYDIMFIKYETFKDNIDKLFDWYNVEESVREKYAVKERESAWEKQSKEVIEGLERIYGDFYQEYLKLPDVIIKNGKNNA